ncbi:UNVERIFIED_CONTAM: hypothetical protein FKN15_002895 [Acipenser sinensis]
MLLSLVVYPVLKTVSLQLHSAFTGGYVSGFNSIALISCPNEQVAKDIARNHQASQGLEEAHYWEDSNTRQNKPNRRPWKKRRREGEETHKTSKHNLEQGWPIPVLEGYSTPGLTGELQGLG